MGEKVREGKGEEVGWLGRQVVVEEVAMPRFEV
jgi:hypothetical protein